MKISGIGTTSSILFLRRGCTGLGELILHHHMNVERTNCRQNKASRYEVNGRIKGAHGGSFMLVSSLFQRPSSFRRILVS